MQIIFILALGFSQGLLSAFILITLGKFGLWDYISLHWRHALGFYDICFFCIGFWLCVAMTGLFFWLTPEPWKYIYLVVPGIGAAVSFKTFGR